MTEHPRADLDPLMVDAVLTASRAFVAMATSSLGDSADDATIAQYRTLVVLASRGPQRMGDLAAALGVTPSTVGRMCDRLARKGHVWRHRARDDRRAVRVSITPSGREVVDVATARRRALIAAVMARLPAGERAAVARALRAFAHAAGEVPDSEWPDSEWPARGPREWPAGEPGAPGDDPRPAAISG